MAQIIKPYLKLDNFIFHFFQCFLRGTSLMTEYVKGTISKEHLIVWVHTCHTPCATEFCHLL